MIRELADWQSRAATLSQCGGNVKRKGTGKPMHLPAGEAPSASRTLFPDRCLKREIFGGEPKSADEARALPRLNSIGPIRVYGADLVFRPNFRGTHRLVFNPRHRRVRGTNVGRLGRVGCSGGMNFVAELIFRFLKLLDGRSYTAL